MAFESGFGFGPVTPQMFAQQMPTQTPGLMPYGQPQATPQLPMTMAPFAPQMAQQPPAQQTTAPPVSLSDIANQYADNQQPNQNDFVQKILSTRFQPDMGDVGTAALRTAQSYAQRQGGATVTPQDIANQRVQTELAPYSTLLDYGIRERQAMPDFTKMAQMAFMKQASGQPMTLQDQAAVNAWRNMGQNGIMFDPSTGNMIQTNTRMPGGIAQPTSPMQAPQIAPNSNPQSNVPAPAPPMSTDQVITNATNPAPNSVDNSGQPLPNPMTPKAKAAFDAKRAEDMAGASTNAATAQATIGNLNSAIDAALAASDKIPGGMAQAAGNELGKNTSLFGLNDLNKNSVLYNQAVGTNILAGLQTLKGLGRLDIPEVNQIIKTYGIGVDNSPDARKAGLLALKNLVNNNVSASQNTYSNMNTFNTGNTQQQPTQPMTPQDSNTVNWTVQNGQLVRQQ